MCDCVSGPENFQILSNYLACLALNGETWAEGFPLLTLLWILAFSYLNLNVQVPFRQPPQRLHSLRLPGSRTVLRSVIRKCDSRLKLPPECLCLSAVSNPHHFHTRAMLAVLAKQRQACL
jgi:hypothetical protein